VKRDHQTLEKLEGYRRDYEQIAAICDVRAVSPQMIGGLTVAINEAESPSTSDLSLHWCALDKETPQLMSRNPRGERRELRMPFNAVG
jgi:hypothetical protein